MFQRLWLTPAAFDSGVPLALKLVEVLGIQQSRKWKTVTLNEFRRFFGLIEHKTFEDITSNPEMAQRLRQFYDHPDDVELYPGLIIEDPKVPMTPGSGLCPPQSIGKAILSDAAALVRGDRFYTLVCCFPFKTNGQDYTQANLTHWGYQVVNSDPDVAQGGVMYRLLMRAFPGWYEYNTVYAMFPFTVPSENKNILTELGVVSQYSFKKPSKPIQPFIFSTALNAKNILGNQTAFHVTYGPGIYSLTGGVEYMIAADLPANTAQHASVIKAIYNDVPKWMDEVFNFYTALLNKLLNKRSYGLGDFYQVDIAREYTPSFQRLRSILSMAHVHFVAQLFNLPLKTEEKPMNPFTEKQLFDILNLIFTEVFLNLDEVAAFKLRKTAAQAKEALADLVKFNVKRISLLDWITKVAPSMKREGFLDHYGDSFIKRLLDQGKSEDEITYIIVATAVGAAGNQAQQVWSLNSGQP